MIEVFWYYVATLAFCFGIVGLLCVYRYYLGNRLNQKADKLKSQMANIKQYYPQFEENRGKIVGEGLGELGVEQIIDELGLPSIVKPFVKGFLSNPDNINKIMGFLKDKGLNFNVNEPKNEESHLL